MAIKRLYSIKDEVANMFQVPVWHHNDGVALRWFKSQFMKRFDNNGMPLNQPMNVDDFTLYYVGDFEDEFGLIEAPYDIVNEDGVNKRVRIGIKEVVKDVPIEEVQK